MIKNKNISSVYLVNGARKVDNVYTEAQLKAVFESHADRDGRLGMEELKKAFASIGSSAPGLRAIRALCHVDRNRDGFIEKDELDNLVRYAAKRGYTIK